jgi:hypothetical protein
MKSKAIWIGLIAVFLVAVGILRFQSEPSQLGPDKKLNTNASTANIFTATPSSSTKASLEESEADRRARMMSNKANRDDFKLTLHDVLLYVEANRSNAVSLVTAFEATRDKDFLKAAAEKFPNDPFVQLKVLLHDVLPEERAKWIEAFKKSSPDNALANLLAARDAMKNGDVKGALAEIAASRSKPYDEMMRESAQALEEAYLAAGRSIGEAKALGMAEITLPHLAQLKKFGGEFLNLAEKSATSGDAKAQQDLLLINWQIGEKLRSAPDSSPLITELVGIAMQNATLKKWPVETPFGDRSASEVIAANMAARAELQNAGPIFDAWFPTAPEQEVISYMDRIKSFGERDAMSWLRQRHPELAQLRPQTN